MPSVEELVKKYHFLKIGDDGVLEMYLDHHALSAFRLCEGYFEASILANLKGQYKDWSLEFGIIWHKVVEEFYIAKRDGTFDLKTWLELCPKLWDEYKMDEQFSEHKSYKILGGLYGLIAMAGQYSEHFATEADRLRIIAIEVTFGKAKEVPLGEFNLSKNAYYGYPNTEIRCFLTGRIDFLMDSGSAIGPLDHKTSLFFKGPPEQGYDPQEGMTGYVYATHKILELQFPELLKTRSVGKIWMNFAALTPTTKLEERFKRVPLFKTPWQLEQYRMRQLRTFHKIYDMLVLGERPDWNTNICNNIFWKPCPFKELHKQNSAENLLTVLKADFREGEAWNPERV